MADSEIFYLDSYLINLFKLMKSGDFNEKSFSNKRNEILRINNVCEKLFATDYFLQLINNINGSLCPHYPPSIILPYQKEESDELKDNISYMNDNNIFMKYLHNSITARCRSRFPAPVLSFKNKFLCRSSTLSGTVEIYGKKYLSNVFGSNISSITSSTYTVGNGKEHFDIIRGEDKKLLEHLKIKYIFDLMLENKKMMFGFPVSSSEKIDRHNRYKQFTIISLPYPGCEFFNDWRLANYQMKGMYFEWDKIEINSKLQIPLKFNPAMCHNIKWDDYMNWDLSELTTNYLKLILGIMIEENCSILVHCISGWDRTPLFTSLVRCLLWADGLLHQSLNCSQMLYLTLAYDWYLFGHQTRTRIERGEEILHFNFKYLAEVAAADNTTSTVYVYGEFIEVFNSKLHRTNSDSNLVLRNSLKESKINSSFHACSDSIVSRSSKLRELCSLFDKLYGQEMRSMLGKGHMKHSRQIISSASNLLNGWFGYGTAAQDTSTIDYPIGHVLYDHNSQSNDIVLLSSDNSTSSNNNNSPNITP